MTQLDKLLDAFRVCTGTFPYKDAVRVLIGLGYEETKTGGGSRRRFVHTETQRIIRLHQPHPSPDLKMYMVKQLQDALIEAGEL